MWMLPHWTLTDNHPAFYDTESGSAIEQTAKVYGAMRTLIGEYNKFADNLNEALKGFELETKEEMECFKKCLTELIENYIKSIDLKIDKQDLKIENYIKATDLKIDQAIEYMTDSIVSTTTEILNHAIAEGKIEIVENYNPETESLEMTTTGGVNDE